MGEYAIGIWLIKMEINTEYAMKINMQYQMNLLKKPNILDVIISEIY